MNWKIRQLLEQYNITPYRLWKESGLARQTVYTLSHDKGDRVDLATLGTVLHALERLIGRRVELIDVLEVVRDGETTGHARLEGAKQSDAKSVAPRAMKLKPITEPMNWDDLPTLPDKTGREQPLEFALTGGVNRAKR